MFLLQKEMTEAKKLGAPYEAVEKIAESGNLPVPNFAAGGIAGPADAALCMALGAEAVFVGSGIFLSDEPARRARAIVEAATDWDAAMPAPKRATASPTRRPFQRRTKVAPRLSRRFAACSHAQVSA